MIPPTDFAGPDTGWTSDLGLPPNLGDGLRLGQVFTLRRQASGRSLAEMSTTTKVHTKYLTALEQEDFSILPSRVFAVGYVRAYAEALGMNGEQAAARFKTEAPDRSIPLQAPTGIAFEDVRKHSPRILGVIAILVLAVVGWNVLQRVRLMQAPVPSALQSIPDAFATAPDIEGPVTLGQARPAPEDQTIPTLYLTPGLEAQMSGMSQEDLDALALRAPDPPVQKAFNPRGAIYGAPVATAQVVLQARKPAAIVVRMNDGRVLFARQLAKGEAWRSPANISAVVDVSDPTAFDVYLNGEYDGPLKAVLTPLAPLNARAGQVARESAAEQLALSTARTQAALAGRMAREQAQAAATDSAIANAPLPSVGPTSARP